MIRLVPDLLTEVAQRAPDREGLVAGRERWTWGRLSAEAEAVARAMVALGVRPGDRVGVLLGKRPEAVAALYGVMQAGAVWVPMDPGAPLDWSAAIAADAGLSALVTTAEGGRELWDMAGPRGQLAGLIVEGRGAGVAPPDAGAASAPGSRSMTYGDALRLPAGRLQRRPGAGKPSVVLYTSGSTGRPKGVVHSHAAMVHLTEAFAGRVRVTEEDRLAVHPPLHFGMSMQCLFPAALRGAVAVLVQLENAARGIDLARLVARERISVWKSVPYALGLLAGATSGELLASLRVVVSGGGAWRRADLARMRGLLPDADLWQSYGSTEATVTCMYRFDGIPREGEAIALGTPIDGTRVALVDDGGRAAPNATEGELWVSGKHVMLGYWGDPERTAAVIGPPPVGVHGGRWYRSGDLVTRRADGLLEFVGRRDRMVKSRGYRVELDQVEAALLAHPRVREAVVSASPHADWGVAVVAWVEMEPAHDGDPAADRDPAAELRAYLARRLPSFMLPARIEAHARLPRTATGKVDRVLLATGALDVANAAT
ncbi:MAG: hypothetical protein QOH61_665 [Chloroflexota bacterium]|nr:hypothetical protein [Chloroflexota bacterium]